MLCSLCAVSAAGPCEHHSTEVETEFPKGPKCVWGLGTKLCVLKWHCPSEEFLILWVLPLGNVKPLKVSFNQANPRAIGGWGLTWLSHISAAFSHRDLHLQLLSVSGWDEEFALQRLRIGQTLV